MLKWIGFIILVAVTTQILAARSITSPTPGEFPIVASTVFSNISGPQIDDVKYIKECGFNVCMHSSTESRFDSLLKFLEGTDLRLMIHNRLFLPYDPITKEWEEKLQLMVDKYKNNPNFAGWEFSDEPQWKQLEDQSRRYSILKSMDPDNFILINLVGQLQPVFTDKCTSLGAYLDTIQSYFNFDVWSSDFYPIIIRDNKFNVDYLRWYRDLSAFSEKARQTGKPMWSYCESMAYTSSNNSRPAATVPYLSFEAFSALAYGAQGIVYWTYYQRPSTSYETYQSALVNLDGKRTKAWYAAQKVNLQIRALTPVFLGAKMIECRHCGNVDIDGIYKKIGDFGPIQSLQAGDKGVLVSHLKNSGKDYILIVNHDVEQKQKINLLFKEDAKVSSISVSSSYKIKRKALKSNSSFTLIPGGYVLLEWGNS